MVSYVRKPTVDEICRTILKTAVEVRDWMSAHPEISVDQGPVRIARRYYDAGAPACWIDEVRLVEGDVEFEALVVKLPAEPEGRRVIYKLLCEHQCERAMMEDEDRPERHWDDPDHSFGEEYCLLRFE
jgi:hypothetical protein